MEWLWSVRRTAGSQSLRLHFMMIRGTASVLKTQREIKTPADVSLSRREWLCMRATAGFIPLNYTKPALCKTEYSPLQCWSNQLTRVFTTGSPAESTSVKWTRPGNQRFTYQVHWSLNSPFKCFAHWHIFEKADHYYLCIILIISADCMRCCIVTTSIAVAVTIFLAVLCVCAFNFLRQKHGESVTLFVAADGPFFSSSCLILKFTGRRFTQISQNTSVIFTVTAYRTYP